MQEVFERWRSRHPDWLVIEGADRTINLPIIRVPRISIALRYFRVTADYPRALALFDRP